MGAVRPLYDADGFLIGFERSAFGSRPVATELLPQERKPKSFHPLIIDIESKAGPSMKGGFVRPFLCGLYDGEEFFAFRNHKSTRHVSWRKRHYEPGGCVDQLLRALLVPEHYGRPIYAHNAGSFDYLFFLAWLMRHQNRFEFEVVPIQSTMLRIDVWPIGSSRRKKARWSFLDSVRLLPFTLEQACQAFGVRGKDDMDLDRPEYDPLWESYLEQDCRGLYDVLSKLHELMDRLGGDVGMTTPATAMKLFMQTYLAKTDQKKILRNLHFAEGVREHRGDKCKNCFHPWVRRSYKGGRTELFQFRGTKLKYFDLNSSYPRAMLEPMPVGHLSMEYGRISWEHWKSGNYVGFAECEVWIPPTCKIPPLPHVLETKGVAAENKLIFPTGRFKGVWDVCELELLAHPLVKGQILSVRKTAWVRAHPIFRDMILELYKLRQHCAACKNQKTGHCDACGWDQGLDALAKLLMNAFYGKFGMKPDRERIVVTDDPTTLPFGSKPAWHPNDPDSILESLVHYAPERADAPYVIPQIASHVTALGRARLWLGMVKVLELGGDVWYADTDSIICNVELPTGSALGEWKDEYPGRLLSFQGAQPKGYLIEYIKEGEVIKKMRWKGVPRKHLTPEGFADLLEGRPVSFPQLGRLRGLARDTGFFGSPQMRTMTKSMRSDYDKRVRLKSDANQTRPLVLSGTKVVEPSYFDGAFGD